MKTAKQKVIDLLDTGDLIGAMRIASKWRDLGSKKEAITRGWAARTNPNFYNQIGENPDELWEEGVSALKLRVSYG